MHFLKSRLQFKFLSIFYHVKVVDDCSILIIGDLTELQVRCVMSFEPSRLSLCYHQSINLQSQVLCLPCVSIIIASESGIIRLISQEALLSLVTSSRASDDMDRGLKKIREACIAAATSDMCALLEDLCRAHFVNHSSLDNR